MFEVIGTITLKSSTETPTLSAVLIITTAYSLSFLGLWLALKTQPLGMTYATWSGVGIAATAIAGIFLFSEQKRPKRQKGHARKPA